MKNDNLRSLRGEIDTIDDKILQLIVERTSIVDQIGILKENTSEVVDINRESEIIKRLLNLHKGNFSKDSIVRIWREIFHTSANIQLKENNILNPKRGINSINLYSGGVSKVTGHDKIIKLSSNESPFGPSKKAIEAYQNSSKKLSRYPELTADSLQNEIAKKYNLNAKQIISGTGSDEVLILTMLTFCSPGDEVIHAEHGFEMYPIMTKYAGAVSVCASEIDFKIDTSSVLQKITESTKLILIANPNNPTGTYLNKNEIKNLLKKIPKNIVVVIDSAYAEFADADDYDKSFSLIDEFDNVLITRTFSKAYSLAGLRLGWGYGSRSLIDLIKKVRPPFNLPPGAISAGIAALNDNEHLNMVIKHNSETKNWFISELKKLGFIAYDTQANFTFVNIPKNEYQNANTINEYLLSKGIAVRYLSSYGLPDSLRITFGKKDELEKVLELLQQFKNDEK